MKRAASLVAATALLLVNFLPMNHAVNAASFLTLHFTNNKQFMIKCSIGLECTVALEPGEEYSDAFNAQAGAWDPHMAYEGGSKLKKPVLILRPGKAANRTNVVLTTTRRTYFLELIPIAAAEPLYYNFQYDDTTYHDLNGQAIATQQAIRAQGGISRQVAPTPADIADLNTACIDYDYTYKIARYLPDEHPHNAKPSSDPYPGTWKPQIVCSDGQHTYIQVAPGAQALTDLPVVFAITSEGDTVINRTFNAARWRFTIDGVYDQFVLELGSQMRPLRMIIAHHNKDGVVPEQQGRHATPIPIPRPIPLVSPSSSPAVVATPVAQAIPSIASPTTPSPAATSAIASRESSPPADTSAVERSILNAAAAAKPTPSPSTVLTALASTPTVSVPTPTSSPVGALARVGHSSAPPRAPAHSSHWEFGGNRLMWPVHRANPIVRSRRTTAVHSKPINTQPTRSSAVLAPAGKP